MKKERIAKQRDLFKKSSDWKSVSTRKRSKSAKNISKIFSIENMEPTKLKDGIKTYPHDPTYKKESPCWRRVLGKRSPQGHAVQEMNRQFLQTGIIKVRL